MGIETRPDRSFAAPREHAAPIVTSSSAETRTGDPLAADATPDTAVVRNRLLGTIVVLLTLYACALAEA